MSEPILRVEVDDKTARRWRICGPKECKLRFRISQSPGEPNPTEWTGFVRVDVSQPHLDLLRFQFPRIEGLRQMGDKLARTLFNDHKIVWLFSRSLAAARHDGLTLRVLINTQPGARRFADSLPWECLYAPQAGLEDGHLGLSGDLGLARFVPYPDLPPIPIAGKLRVLVVVANPHRDRDPLDVRNELAALRYVADARRGQIELHDLPEASWNQFQDAFPGVNPHVLFFCGHGELIDSKPHLVFQTPSGCADPVAIERFASRILPGRRRLGLVVLSACGSAVAAADGSFASAARELVDQGVPAVIAMQSKILDAAAREFDLQLFSYLLQQRSIDASINAGRRAIVDFERTEARQPTSQWPIPVLYLRSRNALFDFAGSRAVSARIMQVRARAEARFPWVVKRFIERPEHSELLSADLLREGVTVIRGPFGAGKTQLITKICTSRIHSPIDDAGSEEPTFLYVSVNQRFDTLDKLIGELDRQGEMSGFLGFRDLLQRARRDDWALASGLSDVLASARCVVVLDDFDGRHDFEPVLFGRLAAHLVTSKVYFVTSSRTLGAGREEVEVVEVDGFTADQVREYFAPAADHDGRVPDELIETAASFGNLPWFLRLLLATREERRFLRSPETMVEDVARSLGGEERLLLDQLAVLRRPVTLQGLALMLDRAEPQTYLEAALRLQDRGLLGFTRELGVELPLPLREHSCNTMSEEELLVRHLAAARFFERRAMTARPEDSLNVPG